MIQNPRKCFNTMERLSKRITAFRMMQGLSQRKLASKAAISVTTLNRVEQGCDVALSTVIKIENALGQRLF